MSLVWFKENNKIRFTVSKNFAEGQCLMEPPKKAGKFGLIAYNMGGGIFNLLFAALFLIGMFALNNNFFSLWGVLFVGFVINVWIAIINLTPLTLDGLPNDGRNVSTALQSKDAMRGFHIILYVNEELGNGKRYRDFGAEVFAVDENADLNNYFVANLVMLDAERLNDLGEYDEAFEQLSRLDPAKLPGFYAKEVKLNLLYYYTVYRPNFEKAKELYEDKAIRAVFRECRDLEKAEFAWVVAAYIFFVLGKKDEALEIIDYALEAVQKRPNLGERVMYTEELERLKACILEQGT